MFTRTYSVHIAAPREAVYDYVSDISRHPEWAHEKLEITLGPEPPGQPGATFGFVAHFLGATPGKGVVVSANRPESFTYDCTDNSGTFRWTFRLSDEAGGTRLSHTVERVSAPVWVKVVQPVVAAVVGNRMIKGGLENIKARMEGARAA